MSACPSRRVSGARAVPPSRPDNRRKRHDPPDGRLCGRQADPGYPGRPFLLHGRLATVETDGIAVPIWCRMTADRSPRGPGHLLSRRRMLLAAGALGAAAAGVPALARALRRPLGRRERLDALTPVRVEAVRKDPDAVRDVY